MKKRNFIENKNGQIEMSFKMIFSIILVITFLGFGFYAITKMVEMQETVQIEKFKDDFQEDVKEMWEGSIQVSILRDSLG